MDSCDSTVLSLLSSSLQDRLLLPGLLFIASVPILIASNPADFYPAGRSFLTTFLHATTITTHSKKKQHSHRKNSFFLFAKFNEQIFYCNSTKDSDPASHKVSLVKGPSAEYIRAYASLTVSCAFHFLSSYTFQTSQHSWSRCPYKGWRKRASRHRWGC